MVGLFLIFVESFLGPFMYVKVLKFRLCNQFTMLEEEQLLRKRIPVLSSTIRVAQYAIMVGL